MKVFIKENIVLITGIALPILMTLIFFAATQIGKATIDPPRYSIVFATNYHENNTRNPYRFIVKDSQLKFQYFPPKSEDEYHNWQRPRLYIFNPITARSQEIEIPPIEDKEEKVDITIPDLTNKKITSLQESPDGYVFEYEYRGGGNIMTEIFGGGHSSRSRHVLRKDNHRVTVPKSVNYNSKFLGWIIEELEHTDG